MALTQKDYFKYIKSAAWQQMRKKYYAYAKKLHGRLMCAACHISNQPLDLHHRTYKRLGQEYLMDLVLLCRPCHEAVHDHPKVNKWGIWKTTTKVIRQQKILRKRAQGQKPKKNKKKRKNCSKKRSVL